MTITGAGTESLLRELAPRALGAVVRRHGHFADARAAISRTRSTVSTSTIR